MIKLSIHLIMIMPSTSVSYERRSRSKRTHIKHRVLLHENSSTFDGIHVRRTIIILIRSKACASQCRTVDRVDCWVDCLNLPTCVFFPPESVCQVQHHANSAVVLLWGSRPSATRVQYCFWRTTNEPGLFRVQFIMDFNNS